MGWAEYISDALLVSESPLESDRFGLQVARVVVGSSSAATVDEVLRAIGEAAADLVIVRYPTSRIEWAHRLSRDLDAIVFHADTLVYWLLKTNRAPTSRSDQFGVSTDPSPETVVRLIGEIFTNYSNHYAANPLLDEEEALAGYQDWAMRTTRSGETIVLMDAEPIAVATTDIGHDFMEILLAGVSPSHQGRGVYAHLLSAVEARSIELGLGSVVISTQVQNAKVQRSWSRYGFVPVESFNTAHVIYEQD